jgi:TolA-binding protein
VTSRSFFRHTLLVAAVAATSACFATRKDVLILQGDLENARRENRQNLEQLQSLLLQRLDSVTRAMIASNNAMADSLRSIQGRFYDTGGRLGDNQSKVLDQLEALNLMVQGFGSELQRQGREMAVLREEMASIKTLAARDTNIGMIPEGPQAKLRNAHMLLQGGDLELAREYASQALTEATDTALMAEAQLFVAETLVKEEERPRADSVLRLVYERYPSTPSAPLAMYRYGLSFKNAMRNAQARDIFNQVIARYPGTISANLARDMLKEIPPG